MEILTWGIFVQRCKDDDDDDDDSSDDEMAATASVLTHQHLVWKSIIFIYLPFALIIIKKIINRAE